MRRFSGKQSALGLLALLATCGVCWGQSPCGPDPAAWQLTFADEFDGPTLNLGHWNPARGFQNKNGELNTFAPENVFVRDGALVVRSERRALDGQQYVSGEVTTLGKFSQLYGRFEARLKIPRGRGLWPAFWMIPADQGWPPEIDIMETIGSQTFTNTMTHYWGSWPDVGSQGSSWTGSQDLSADFHVYTLDWTPTELRWYVDGVARRWTSVNVPSKPFMIVIGAAVGGNFPGPPDASTVFPQEFVVDYVHAYSRKDLLELRPILINAGFEDSIGAGVTSVRLPSWTTFGNAYRERANWRSGLTAAKVFGNFTGFTNRSGLSQDLPAQAGQVWRASVYAQHVAGDALVGGNRGLLRVEWLDANRGLISATETTVLTSVSPVGQYLPTSRTLVAPSGTRTARVVLAVEQLGFNAGAVWFDDAELVLVSTPPGCSADANGDLKTDVSDIFVFLSRWFAKCNSDYDGNGRIDVSDIFAYLGAWYAGCPQ